MCVSLLAGGLLAVLVLNAALAQGSFELGRLQAASSELADQQESLTQSIDEQRSPERLASRARTLGMVPATSAAFLRLSDGEVLGVAKPASSDDGFSVVPTTPGSGTATPAPAPTSGAPGGQPDTGGEDGNDTKKATKNEAQADPRDGTKKQDGDQPGTSGGDTDGTKPGTADRTRDGGVTDSTTEGP